MQTSPEHVFKDANKEELASYASQWASVSKANRESVPLTDARRSLIASGIVHEEAVDQVLRHFHAKDAVTKNTYFAVLGVLSRAVQMAQAQMFSTEEIGHTYVEDARVEKQRRINRSKSPIHSFAGDDPDDGPEHGSWAIAAIAAARGVVRNEPTPTDAKPMTDAWISSSLRKPPTNHRCPELQVEEDIDPLDAVQFRKISPSSAWKAFDFLALDECPNAARRIDSISPNVNLVSVFCIENTIEKKHVSID